MPDTNPDLGSFEVLANPTIDPNTGMPPVATSKSSDLPPATEQSQFVDEWAKAPADNPPVRTWVDAGVAAADPDYMAAWDDEPATVLQDAAAAPAPAGALVAAAPAAAPASAATGAGYTVSYEGPTDSSDGMATVMDSTGKVITTLNGLTAQAALGNRGQVSAEDLARAGYTVPVAPAPTATPVAGV